MRTLAFLSVFLASLALFPLASQAGAFKEGQLRFSKVRAAAFRKGEKIREMFEAKKVPFPPRRIFLRAFKEEGELEVWAPEGNANRYRHLTTFPFCAVSGKPGPKRRQGDKQTPEGFYFIEQFNPASGYHLSLKISYPNVSDKRLGEANPGGNIYIHGGCGTRGCLPLTDERVEELYLIAMEAKDQGQEQIPIHIYPARLNEKKFRWLAKQFPEKGVLLNFWKSLQKDFEYFEKRKTPAPVLVNAEGVYLIKTDG